MYSTAEFKKGLKIELDGVPYTIVDFQHVKPGKGGAFVRTKMKSLLTGRVLDQTFRSGEKVKRPDLMEREMQYLYREGGDFHMMDNETYEQIHYPKELLGEQVKFLRENMEVLAVYVDDKLTGIELPANVVLTVVSTVPGVKGDSVSNMVKPCTLDTGLEINVPLFVKEGDKIRVDTRTSSYMERVKE